MLKNASLVGNVQQYLLNEYMVSAAFSELGQVILPFKVSAPLVCLQHLAPFLIHRYLVIGQLLLVEALCSPSGLALPVWEPGGLPLGQQRAEWGRWTHTGGPGSLWPIASQPLTLQLERQQRAGRGCPPPSTVFCLQRVEALPTACRACGWSWKVGPRAGRPQLLGVLSCS